MKKLVILLLVLFFCEKTLCAQQISDLSKYYKIISRTYTVPGDDKNNFANINFRFAWTGKAPNRIAIQFVDNSYSDYQLKFAIKDITSKKMIVLNPQKNICFGMLNIEANSESAIWAGPVDNINDTFSLQVWDSNGNEFDTEPTSLKDQE